MITKKISHPKIFSHHDAPIRLTDAMGEAGAAVSLDSPDQATVYVDGIPFSATSDDLRFVFTCVSEWVSECVM